MTPCAEDSLPATRPHLEQRGDSSSSIGDAAPKEEPEPSEHQKLVRAIGNRIDDAIQVLSPSRAQEFQASARLVAYIDSLPLQRAIEYVESVAPVILELSVIDLAHMMEDPNVRSMLNMK